MNALQPFSNAGLASRRLLQWAGRLLLDRHAEFWLGEIDRTRSLAAIRARVVAVITETHDTKTLHLRPNGNWRGHRAGQHTVVEVEIDGVRVRRCYSISSPPGEPLLAITVKRVIGGRVSQWLHDRVRPGDVLGLSPACGAFVLPEPVPKKLLLYSGGSGITPLMAMVRELSARGAVRDLVFVHHARSRQDVIFGNALADLDARHGGLRLVLRLDDEGAGMGFDPAWLGRQVPDFAERLTMLCGPPGLMAAVEQMWERAGLGARLKRERFVGPAAAVRVAPSDTAPVRVQLCASGRSVLAVGSRSLLEQLEQAGERPAHGCRMGICQTCKCRKRTGVVRNLITGAVSEQPDEDIQLCISAPQSDVTLLL